MRTASRALVAGAVAVPLLFGAPSAALASSYDSGDKGHHGIGQDKWGKYWDLYKNLNGGGSEQDSSNETDQANVNNTEVYQVSIGNEGDTDQSFDNDTDQKNDNYTDQLQAAFSE